MKINRSAIGVLFASSLLLSACGADREEAEAATSQTAGVATTAQTPSTPTAPRVAELIRWTSPLPAAGDYSEADVAEAATELQDFLAQWTFPAAVAEGRSATAAELEPMKQKMTPDVVDGWAPKLAVALVENEADSTGPMSADMQGVWGLTSFSISASGDTALPPSNEPLVVDWRIDALTATVADNGDLFLHVEQSANLRLRWKGDPYLKPFTRTYDFWMIPNGAGSAGNHWLLNGWDGKWQLSDGGPES